VPSLANPTLWNRPAEIPLYLTLPTRTATGNVLESTVPSPNWPELFRPQAYTLRSLPNARL
jgi:hypothetical protein